MIENTHYTRMEQDWPLLEKQEDYLSKEVGGDRVHAVLQLVVEHGSLCVTCREHEVSLTRFIVSNITSDKLCGYLQLMQNSYLDLVYCVNQSSKRVFISVQAFNQSWVNFISILWLDPVLGWSCYLCYRSEPSCIWLVRLVFLHWSDELLPTKVLLLQTQQSQLAHFCSFSHNLSFCFSFFCISFPLFVSVCLYAL